MEYTIKVSAPSMIEPFEYKVSSKLDSPSFLKVWDEILKYLTLAYGEDRFSEYRREKNNEFLIVVSSYMMAGVVMANIQAFIYAYFLCYTTYEKSK